MNNRYVSLIRREFWEHFGTFVALPVILMLSAIVIMFLIYVSVDVVGVEANVQFDTDDSEFRYESDNASIQEVLTMGVYKLQQMPDSQRVATLRQGLFVMGLPFQVILWVVIFFYLLGTLYEDRRDRSILFWKSMPVSDTETVLAKLIAGCLLAPLIYAACTMGVQLAVMSISSFYLVGEELPVWEVVWEPARLLFVWGDLLVVTLVQILWSIPFYGWVLVVSAWAKSLPLVWVLAIPFGVGIVESVFTRDGIIVPWLTSHASRVYIMKADVGFEGVGATIFGTSGLVGMGVGALLVAVAIWMRGRADEI